MMSVLQKLKQLVLVVMCYACTSFAAVHAGTAVQALEGVANQLQHELQANEDKYRDNPAALNRLVDKVIAPYIDFAEMSRWVIGRQAWQSAPAPVRQEFTKAFRTLLIQTYAGSLISYKDHKIEYLPQRNGATSNGRVQVDTVVHAQGSEPIRVAYRMWQQGGQWKVYDIIIEGVSLLRGFQSQFADDLRVGGVPRVTERLIEHNEEQ